MALRDLMARMGAGGASVDTQLASGHTQPGGTVSGRVRLTGGKAAQEVRAVLLALQTRVEIESGDSEFRDDIVFGSAQLTARPFELRPGQVEDLPFRLVLPLQCPVTRIGGWSLPGVRVGVKTTVDVAGAVDPGDLDPVEVQPLPVQQAVLEALAGLGFAFRSADVELGRLRGADLPFYQEFEFLPGASGARGINQLEVTFLTDPAGVDVVLEADRRGGLLTAGHDALTRLRLSHSDTDPRRVATALEPVVRQLTARRGWL